MRKSVLVLVFVLLLAAITVYASTTHLNYLPVVFTSPLPTPIPTLTVIPEMPTLIP